MRASTEPGPDGLGDAGVVPLPLVSVKGLQRSRGQMTPETRKVLLLVLEKFGVLQRSQGQMTPETRAG